MTSLISGHRSTLGALGVLAFAVVFATPALGLPTAAELAILAVALLGLCALVGSPYWEVMYRESPLRRAVSDVTDLDERELALRDRANGLTYYLFATFNIVAIAFCWGAARFHWLVLDPQALMIAIVPYACFAVCLPVIMLEWFEPSATGAALDAEEKEIGA
jgi:hypothetical protein